MADDEKESFENENDDEDGRDAEVERLRDRIDELELQLSQKREGLSPAARWGGWILGTLVGATSLALIVVMLGGGFPIPCECSEDHDEQSGQGGGQQQHQAALERLFREHTMDFQECFDAWATAHASEVRPGWSVIVRLDVEAGVGGRVQEARASGENLPDALGGCLERRVRTWTFPAEGPYTLELPFAVEGSPLPSARSDGGGAIELASDGGAVVGDAASP